MSLLLHPSLRMLYSLTSLLFLLTQMKKPRHRKFHHLPETTTHTTLSSLLTCPGIHICLLFLWPPLPYSFQVLFNFLLVPREFHTMNLTILPLSTLPRSTPLPYQPNLCLLPTPSAPIKYSLWCPHFPVWPVTVVYSTYLFSCEEMVDSRRRRR